MIKTFNEFINENKISLKDANSFEEEFYIRYLNNKWPNDRKYHEKIKDKVIEESKEKAKNLEITKNSKEQDILDTYVSIQYKEINNQLRKNKISIKNQKVVNKIDEIISNYTLKEDLIVYRGVAEDGIVRPDNAFKSCSLSIFIAWGFSRFNAKLFRFKIPKGTNYAYIGGGEFEILFARDLELKKYLF